MNETAEATKKSRILKAAHALGKQRFTSAEIEQIRRQLLAEFGSAGKTAPDYIASVLSEARLRVVLSKNADATEHYEEEFQDLLHFSTLEEAEMCIVRLDELFRKFVSQSESAAAERVREIGRLGLRRAEMIAHNQKVEPTKRAQKQEIAQWFRIWLETPDAFFDWLDVRRASPDFVRRFGDQTVEGA